MTEALADCGEVGCDLGKDFVGQLPVGVGLDLAQRHSLEHLVGRVRTQPGQIGIDDRLRRRVGKELLDRSIERKTHGRLSASGIVGSMGSVGYSERSKREGSGKSKAHHHRGWIPDRHARPSAARQRVIRTQRAVR